jgi:ribosomal protein L33
MHFTVHQSIDVHIIYLCCEYQPICSDNEWFICFLVLANQIQVHAYARADGQFWPPWSIKCLDIHLWYKYQANPMQNNEVIVYGNVPRYNTFARAHVHAHAGQLFWPFRSVGDLNIYPPYKFEWIWTKNKKVSFARLYVQKFKRTCTRVHAFSEKMTIVRNIYKR